MFILFGEMPLQCLLLIFLILLSFQSFLKNLFRILVLWNIWNIFFHSVASLFMFLIGSFTGQKVFILVKPNLPIFSFMDPAFDVKSKNVLPTPDSNDFSHKSFIVLFLNT